jgi:MoaA/NifB/PqqE/SkfB family radical SAM enzyme
VDAGIERLSIELTNRCDKGCGFCYAASTPDGGTEWTDDDVVGFVVDCAGHGTKAVSFGGGEPLHTLASSMCSSACVASSSGR